MHGNTESNVESTAEWTPLAVFPAHFSLRRSRYLNAWNRVVQGKKRLWTHNMIRIKLTPPSLPPPPPRHHHLLSPVRKFIPSFLGLFFIGLFVRSLSKPG